MKKALFPGTFDPITNGHVDIIRRASLLFDEVVVLVGVNMSKKTLFTTQERVDMIQRSLSSFDNVTVDSWDGLTVKYAVDHGCGYIIRGLRDSRDFEYEHELELNNRFIAPNVETVYLSADEDNLFVRSTSIREFLRYGVDFSSLVPPVVYEEIQRKIASK